jgi:2-dehydropantoate 2-reductase
MEPVHIVGCGGIGCAVGYALRHAGVPAVFVDANPTKVEWGRAHGVAVQGRAELPAEFRHFADWNPPEDAVVFLCTKCYDNSAVLSKLPVRACLIPIQNGFDAALDERGHGLEGIASFVSECIPGQTTTRITRPGKLHLGYRRASKSEPGPGQFAWASLIDVLKRARLFRVRPVGDILPYKYTKLMYNAAISPLAAAAGIDNGQLLSIATVRRLFFALLSENYEILRRAGISLGKVGPFHPRTVDRILRHRRLARCLSWAFYPTLRGTYCSMSADLPAGRTEIDYYNRHLIDLAGDRPCPLNHGVYELVRRMERERLRPCVPMLDDLLPLAA